MDHTTICQVCNGTCRNAQGKSCVWCGGTGHIEVKGVVSQARASGATCHKCGHPMWEHHTEFSDKRYGCWERLSLDNNDFCGCQHGAPAKPTLVFYAIKNEHDEWYKTYSSGGRRRGWKKNIVDARIYAGLATARAKVTSLANEFPMQPIPMLVELVVTEQRIVNQEDRVAKSRHEKEKKDAERQLRSREWEIECAQRQLEEAQAKLAKFSRDR